MLAIRASYRLHLHTENGCFCDAFSGLAVVFTLCTTVVVLSLPMRVTPGNKVTDRLVVKISLGLTPSPPQPR